MKLIENVKPLQQFMEDGSFLMPEIPAAYRALQAAGAPDFIDYDYLLSVSGMAVRLSWQPGWAAYDGIPNQASEFFNGDPYAPIKLALDRSGTAYRLHMTIDTGIDRAERDIIESVDRGVPVVVSGPSVMSAVTGYDDGELFGVGTFMPQDKRDANGYNKLDGWRRELKAYFMIEKVGARTPDKALLGETISTAVALARTEAVGNAVCGIKSFDALSEMLVWDESFEPFGDSTKYSGKTPYPYDRSEGFWRDDGAHDLGSRFWAGYCDYLCMLNGYSNFSRFLDKYAFAAPEWESELRRAAGYYMRACDYSGELWNYVTPDDAGVLKFKNREVRYAFAAHMLRAKIYTVKAVEALEALL